MRRTPLAYWISTILAASAGAQAQDQTDSESEISDQIVVTGTRVADRSRLDTVSPVDVLPASELSQQATTELAEALSNLAPSLNFPRPSITDGTDHIRPATLRGLAPDQTLVLVNSKRRHQSALVNVNGSIGRGSAAVDLNAIPVAAIESVEVLRDGASAQYGSDAIAGVINIRLREARDGGNASVTFGEYNTDVETARGTRSESDGAVITASAWTGLPLGSEGFLTLTGEYRDREPTSRGDFDLRVAPVRVTSRYGDADVQDATFYANAGVPVGADWELYGWAGYQNREGNSAAFPRIFNDARNVPAIYPDGFLPKITTDIDDITLGVGTRGELLGWAADVSVVYGKNDIAYGVINSLNTSFGAASQTSFDAGGMDYDQAVFNAGLVREFDWGMAGPTNVAIGVEGRRESYGITAGEPASYLRGPVTTAPAGSQGFPGFQPSNEVDESRNAVGAYVDVEAQVAQKFLASAALRAEDYSDFGSTVNGKLSGRFDATDLFAVRATVATGFRAPGLQQSFFTSTATNFINGVPFEIGTFPATAPVSEALGARELDAEESVNYSLGFVFQNGEFEATLDFYRIDIDDRIVLSENLGGRPDVDAILAPFGVSRARFFVNGVDTKTEGVDLVVRYGLPTESMGRFDFTLSGNLNDTEITQLPELGGGTINPPIPLFARINSLTFEEGTPQEKATVSTDWELPTNFGSFGTSLAANYYGKVTEPGTAASGANDIPMGSAVLVDLEFRARVGDGLSFTLGADNVLDKYPSAVPSRLNATGALGFSRYSAFGFGGRFLYARLGYNW